MKKKSIKKDLWLDELRVLVYDKSLVIFRFSEEDWSDIANSRRGVGHFTVARSHASLEHVRIPTVCLIFTEEFGSDGHAFIAILSSRSAVSTLDTRVTIERAQQMSPLTEGALAELLTDKALATNLRKRLAKSESVIRLSPQLSSRLIERLAEIESNRRAMRRLIDSLEVPRTYSSNSALQEDAVNMALRVFGISPYDSACSLDMVERRKTALARINIREDTVIEHDAR